MSSRSEVSPRLPHWSFRLTLLLLMGGALLPGVSQPAPAAPAGAPDAGVPRRLKAHIDAIRLIDTHEHLGSEADYLKRPADFLVRMLHYVESDLISAGMPPASGGRPLRVQDPAVPPAERWELFLTWWREMRLTGYGRALARSARDLYGVDLDNPAPDSWARMNERVGAENRPGLYHRILKDKARIDLSIVDIGRTRVDAEFFVPVIRFDGFVSVRSGKDLDNLGSQHGVAVKQLPDLVQALERAFTAAAQDGIVGIKSGLAYSRRIDYPRPTDAEAAAAFAQVRGGGPVTAEEALPLQNYLMHQVCRLAARHRLPFQIHTGLQTGSGNRITHSKPTDLVNLIEEYPDVKFVIFHGGYPYGHELGTMAKNFPNVFIDLCWLHIISPKVARDSLSEWIETVPANKITGFGGDFLYVEGAYAHAEMAREVVAAVLTQKVLEGYLSESDARMLAVKLLRDNAIALYQLKLAPSALAAR